MTSWHHRAACVGLPLELFFGADEERGHARENREEHARRICASCRVRIDCLIDATRNNESGFWGGMTEKERKSKRRRDRCKAPPEHPGNRMNLHGTRRRYIHGPDINNQPGRGCRCEHCRTADRRGRKLHHLAVIRGQARPEVDAQPIRTHLQVLCAAGMTRQAIARQAGVAHSLLSRLIHGDARTGQTVKTVRAKNADAILAVQATPAGELLIPATGTRRRLQSLAWRGWPRAIVAAHTGLAQQHLWRLTASNSTTRVSASTAIRVAQASRYLHLITPELAGVHPRQAALTRKRALAAGWLSLMAWDDLDDPDAVPDLGRRVTRDEALLEDSEELIGQGYTMEQAAERLGVNRKYLSTVRSRGRKPGRAVTADV